LNNYCQILEIAQDNESTKRGLAIITARKTGFFLQTTQRIIDYINMHYHGGMHK
jgi:hypothetical protein